MNKLFVKRKGKNNGMGYGKWSVRVSTLTYPFDCVVQPRAVVDVAAQESLIVPEGERKAGADKNSPESAIETRLWLNSVPVARKLEK